MEIKTNTFKKNSATATTYGIWNGLVDTVSAEILAGSGFDWILVDAEHAPFDIRTLQHQLQAIATHSTPAIVRPPVGDATLIKQVLDIGAQTLLVPMVTSAHQATLLVEAMAYPPQGCRGVGTALARAAQWNRVDNYFEKANNEMCLICQVETVSALDNLEKIAAVKGVDGVFVGPSDLAASMGYIGQPHHPKVVETVCKALKAIRLHGKIAGVLAVSEELVHDYEKAGANMIGVGIDTLVLSREMIHLANTYKLKMKTDNAPMGNRPAHNLLKQ